MGVTVPYMLFNSLKGKEGVEKISVCHILQQIPIKQLKKVSGEGSVGDVSSEVN